MVFGAVESEIGSKRRGNVLRRFLLAVTVDVDVESLLGDVVGKFALVRAVVIVPNDRLPLAVMVIFELDDEPNDVTTVRVEPETTPDAVLQRRGELSVVLPRFVLYASY